MADEKEEKDRSNLSGGTGVGGGKELTAGDIVCPGHLKRVFPLPGKLRDVGCDRDTASNRTLHFDDYCKLVLLYTRNPLPGSVRDLRKAVGLKHVAKAPGAGRFPPGGFSESPRVFEPGLLKGVIAEPAGEVGELRPLPRGPRLGDPGDALTPADGTVLAALPRLARAAAAGTRYCTARDGRGRYGWRLHTQLGFRTFTPRRIERTGACASGGAGEADVPARSPEAGRCYVNDGGCADSRLPDGIIDAGSNSVGRLRGNSVFEVLDERFLSDRAPAAGVVRGARVRWGGRHPIRVVYVQVEPRPPRGGRDGPADLLVIATGLPGSEAELVALIYRQRYSVGLSFRPSKQLPGMRHLPGRREEGADVQVYRAAVVCLPVNLITGKKPDKAMAGMVGRYLPGVATEQELIDYLNKPDNTGIRERAKDELWKKLGC